MIGNQPDGTCVVKQQKKCISISQLNMLSKCGEQYYRRYILGEKLPSSVSLCVGIAVDRSVTRNLERKMERGELRGPTECEIIAIEEYDRCFQTMEVVFTQDELLDGKEKTILEGRKKAARLAMLHAVDVAPNLNPTHLQRPLRVELPGYMFDINGVIDIQEYDSVRDTKTAGKTPARDIADKDDQLTVYALLVMLNDGAIPPKLILDYLVDNKTPVYKPFETTRIEEDFNPLIERIAVAELAIQSGVFMPARETDWWCSEKWCGFFKSCKYVKQSRRAA